MLTSETSNKFICVRFVFQIFLPFPDQNSAVLWSCKLQVFDDDDDDDVVPHNWRDCQLTTGIQSVVWTLSLETCGNRHCDCEYTDILILV